MDVGRWLRSLGLSEYEARFRDTKIDADVLADLTDGDLEKLGLPLGDRKRLLKAVAGLAGMPSAATGPEPPKPSRRRLDGRDAIFQHDVMRCVFERQSGEPAPVHQGPGRPVIMTAMAQQKAGELLARLAATRAPPPV